MKHRYIIGIGLLCLVLAGGCMENPKYGAPVSIRVFGVMGRPDLDPDLKLGLFADEPVGIDNIPFTLTENGTVISEKDIRWAFDQSRASRFFAYAPYDESFSGQESVVLTIPADQSTENDILKGNLLMAVSSGTPRASAVTMRMKHALTAMMVRFDNRTGQKIKKLDVIGFMTVGTLNLITGEVTATGGKKIITPLRSPFDSNTFCFIYMPQDVTPVFSVTLESGKVIDITYDNYCHEYPDRVIYMDDILLTENTPEANILSLPGVNHTSWNTNGIPLFGEGLQYLSLSELGKVEPDKEDGFFSAYLNKVTVTAVDATRDDIQGLILEDGTCAIHVWAHEDTKLAVGNTIVGPVLGSMEKQKSGDEVMISNFYTKYATVSKGDSLPCTETGISQIAENIDKMEFRRVRLRNVELKECFDNGRAVFVQDAVEFSMVCQNIDSRMAAGISGDLVGFPVKSGSDFNIMVYDTEQFSSFSKEPADNAFTCRNDYGMYDLSDADTVRYDFAGFEDGLQVSVRRNGYDRSMQVTDTRNGYLEYFYIYDFPEVPVVGHEYNVAFNVTGNTELQGCTMIMECVRTDNDTVWLVDMTGTKGLVLAL